MKKVFSFILFSLIMIMTFVIPPLAIISALNAVFGLGIAYTFTTWLGMLVLCVSLIFLR